MRTLRIVALSLLAGIISVVAVGTIYEAFAEARDANWFPPPGKMIDVGGRRLHLLCKGHSDGPVVIMVAGGGTPAVVSYPLQDRIAKFARVCSYDRAGLGWSDPSVRPLTFADQIDDLEKVLHIGRVKGPYVFVPESFGSLIVIGFAAKHPDQVAGIVFIDGVDPQLWFRAMANQSGIVAELKGAVIRIAWRIGVVRLAFPILAPAWVEDLLSPTKGEMTAIYSRPESGYAEALEAYLATPVSERPHLFPSALGDRPVIVLRHGKVSDALSYEFEAGWQASQTRLARLSRKGTIVVATDADHEVAQENPALAAAAVCKVLKTLSPDLP